MRVESIACALLTLPIAAPAAIVHAGGGDLDPSFGSGDGFVITDLGAVDRSNAIALQPDGRILVAGTRSTSPAHADFAVVRYLDDGALDLSFGEGGVVFTDFGSYDEANAIAVQPDGRIVVGGNGAETADFALARYLSDGSLDPTFGADGKVLTDFGLGSGDVPFAMTLLPDGRIVLAGWARVGVSRGFALARYLSDGSLDPTFGAGGTVTTDTAPGYDDQARTLVAIPDGRLVAAGDAQDGLGVVTLVGYLADGELDPDFGDGGIARHPTGEPGFAVSGLVRRQDGRLLVAGRDNGPFPGTDLVLGQFLADGSADPGFGTSGLVFPELGELAMTAVALAVADGGRFLVAGYATGSADQEITLLRFTAEGALDPEFGSGGLVLSDLVAGDDWGSHVVLQRDGRILVAAWGPGGSQPDFLVARYLHSLHALTVPALGPLGLTALALLIAALAVRRLRG